LRYGYTPPSKLQIDPSLTLHEDHGGDIDPITYEVIRSKLWDLNLDHSETIQRTSGSQMVAEGNDLNIALTTETGEGVVFGPYGAFFAGFADLAIKWTLEFRSSNPGIAEGDVFVHDDPWIADNHASDVCVYAPVFRDDALFAWVYSIAHHRDVGGPVPHSVNPSALSAFEEPSLWPAVKIIEGGRVRQDILDLWTRRSRLPEVSGLELKAQFAGISFASGRLTEIIERYGPGTVKRAMTKRIEEASRLVGERLSRLPDGIWRDVTYLAGAGADDLKLYKSSLSFEKRGDRLRISNAGTDPSVGVLNCTPGCFRGAVGSPLFDMLGWDIELCGGGLWRQIDVDVEQGTITSATYPSAVGSSNGLNLSLSQARTLGVRLVSGDPELAEHAVGSMIHTLNMLVIAGEADQYGKPVAGMFMDRLEGSTGATAGSDGLEHSGPGYLARIPDVEEVERALPVLCLYRRSLPESGAHGRFRGRGGIESAFLGHRGSNVNVMMMGKATSVPDGKSADGAWPPTAGTQLYARESTASEWLEQGRIPTTMDDIRKTADLEQASRTFRPFQDSSIYAFVTTAGGSFGDPLTRDPEAVRDDLTNGRVTEEEIEEVYGVVLADGGVDFASTDRKRLHLFEERIGQSRQPRNPYPGKFTLTSDTRRVLASIAVSEDRSYLGCAHCGQRLSPADGNFRLGCRELERTLPSLSPLYENPEVETGEQLVFRQYICPGCAQAVDGDVCKPTDEPYPAFELLGEP
jgi:N-methylhydantoinase B